MSTFADIYGHDKIKEHLQKSIELDKVSHAYIFNGGLGAGKKTIAKLFAKTLQCEKHGIEPCNECHSCIQADSSNQPDIIWIRHEKPGSIGVDDIREQLIGDMQIKPYSSRYKIYIIDEAEKLTVQAQNALLKTIEEPPAYGIVIMLTTNADIFLQTILSRCVRLDFKPVADELVVKYLKDNYDVTDYETKFAAAFAQGNIGRAVTIVTSGDFAKLKDEVLHVVRLAQEMTVSEIMAEVKNIANYKLTIDDYLDLMASGIVMCWYLRVPMMLIRLFLRWNCRRLKVRHHIFLMRDCRIYSSIDKVKIRLKANVNFDLVIELLIMAIKQAV